MGSHREGFYWHGGRRTWQLAVAASASVDVHRDWHRPQLRDPSISWLRVSPTKGAWAASAPSLQYCFASMYSALLQCRTDAMFV